MLFFFVLPLIVFVIVFYAVKNSAEQKRRADAQQRDAQMQQQQAASEGQTAYTPVRPSVQPNAARKAEPAQKPAPGVRQGHSRAAQPVKQMHPEHDLCALRPDSAKESGLHTHKDNSASQRQETPIDFNPQSVLQGVIFSEILGKPKALR